MSLDLKGLQDSVLQISDIYAREHGIDRDKAASGDWALLKVQEELGELTAEHLRMSGRARGAADAGKLGDEAADVLGMLLIYCAGPGSIWNRRCSANGCTGWSRRRDRAPDGARHSASDDARGPPGARHRADQGLRRGADRA
jgi:NTP pyrophosphatase (non-canonical NTP hydrolase)